MSFTETQYTVKVPLNPTGFPTNDKVVIWDTSEGRFQLRDDGGCQLVYQWNTTSPVTQAPSQGQLSITTSSFSANTSSFNYIGFSLTSYTGNDLTNYLTGITSASFVITLQNDPSYFMAFNANILATSNGVIVYNIIENTFSSSSPPASGTPENGELLCVSIIPISVSTSTGSTSCENIESIGINFSGAAINDNITFTIASGLTINTGISVQLTYTPDPSIFVIGETTDYNASTGSITINLTYISSDGYCCGAADENDVCYYLTIENDLFIFQRTLFVDPNGDDGIASSIFPYGGTLHPPFKTIQAAITYANDNYTYGQVTIHVFAGVYDVTEQDPITLGSAFINMNLYLEDGALLNCNAINPSTLSGSPSYYLYITGTKEVSISGHGKISTGGSVSDTTFINIFQLDGVSRVNIILKKIYASLRSSRGTVFYYVTGSDNTSNIFFEGELIIDSVNLGLLEMKSTQGGKTRTFEFGHESIINILQVDTDAFYRSNPVTLNYESIVIVRGSWYIKPDTNHNRTLFYYDDESALCIIDGADMYLDVHSVYPDSLMVNRTNKKCYFELRSRSTTNAYIDTTQNIINKTYGQLEQYVPITPTILPL